MVGQARSIACPKYGLLGPGLIKEGMIRKSLPCVCHDAVGSMQLTLHDTSTKYPPYGSNDRHQPLVYRLAICIFGMNLRLCYTTEGISAGEVQS